RGSTMPIDHGRRRVSEVVSPHDVTVVAMVDAAEVCLQHLSGLDSLATRHRVPAGRGVPIVHRYRVEDGDECRKLAPGSHHRTGDLAKQLQFRDSGTQVLANRAVTDVG